MPKRILVVDDHDVVRKGVLLILRARADWEVVGEASNGIEAIEKVEFLKPDLIILDISMPGKDGLEVIKELGPSEAPPKILVLTMHQSNELLNRIKSMGAAGYVIKTGASTSLIQAIDEIFGGGTFFPTPRQLSQGGGSGEEISRIKKGSRGKGTLYCVIIPLFAT